MRGVDGSRSVSSASVANSGTYTVTKSLPPDAVEARAKWYTMRLNSDFSMSRVQVANTPMTANNTIVYYPFMPAPVVVYTCHTAELTTTMSITEVSIQYEKPLGTFYYTTALPMLVP